MARIGRGSQTQDEKLKDIRETQQIDEALIKHYIFIQEHWEELVAVHDKEIIELQTKKASILQELHDAPQKLIDLRLHLVEMRLKYKGLKDLTTGKTQRIKKFKILREKFAALKAELEAEGIDIEQCQQEVL